MVFEWSRGAPNAPLGFHSDLHLKTYEKALLPASQRFSLRARPERAPVPRTGALPRVPLTKLRVVMLPRMWRPFGWLGLISIGLLALGCQPDAPSGVLTSVNEVEQATLHQEQHGTPVKLEGVVTYSDPSWGFLFVQDETGGLALCSNKVASNPVVGQRVQLTGIVGPPSTSIDSLDIEVVGSGSLPTPASLTLGDITLNQHSGDWISTEGVVRAVERQADRLMLNIGRGNDQASVQIFSSPDSSYASLLGVTFRYAEPLGYSGTWEQRKSAESSSRFRR